MLTVVSSRLKKVLRSRVELWIVAILLSLAALGFSATPANLYSRFLADPPEPYVWGGALGEQRFHGRAGLEVAQQERTDGEAGYLVVARNVSFPDAAEPVPESPIYHPVVVEIIDLNRRRIVHSWKPVLQSELVRFNVLPDGSLIGGGQRWTFRLDACSNVVWRQPLRAHHSYERGVDGDFWSPWRMAPKTTFPHANPNFVEDGFITFSPAGEVLSRTALAGALMRAGHGHLLYGMGARTHGRFNMNDVEPVLQDGPFWRSGDLFVSLRNRSTVLLYRPATDEVLWLQAGPWLHQHDVDVVSDSEISVYSNNTVFDERDNGQVLGANEVYVHDFATGETRSPWREAMRRHDVRTAFRGGATVFGDGSVMLEEADSGRILMLAPDGEEVWSYVNRASDGMVYGILASRWLDAEYGAEVVRSIASLDCGGAEMDCHHWIASPDCEAEAR